MAEQWEEELEKFLVDNLVEEIRQAEAKDRDFVELDCDKLFQYSELPGKFFEDPETVLERLGEELDSDLNIRPFNVPEEVCGISIGELGVKHAGELVVVKGVLQTATDPKGKCRVATFKCQRCGQLIKVKQSLGEGIRKPTVCSNPNCVKKGPFKLQEENSIFVDYQFADIQEKPTEIEGSQQARSKLAYLEGSDLMDKVEPGQEVILVGVPTLIQEKNQGKRSNTFNIWIKSLNIRIDEEKYYAEELTQKDEEWVEKWKEKEDNVKHTIVNSLAPSIENSPPLIFEVKEAICLQTVGCPQSDIERRSTINILLCGDPGVAKTRLAQKATGLRPGSQYASGARSSGPGLTASVVRGERTGEWLLKAGRLILASKAVLAIDDYEELTENKGQLLEAMSIEQVSISKVINRTLPAQTSILALADPEYGRFDIGKDVHKQLPTEPAEHSRYDLIFAIQDKVGEERDSLIGEKIYDTWRGKKNRNANVLPEKNLKKIIAYARSIGPNLPENHKEKLKNFYVKIR